MKQAFIKTTANGYTFLHFFNSTRVYSMQGFMTERKAKNYAKKYQYQLHTELPNGISSL